MALERLDEKGDVTLMAKVVAHLGLWCGHAEGHFARLVRLSHFSISKQQRPNAHAYGKARGKSKFESPICVVNCLGVLEGRDVLDGKAVARHIDAHGDEKLVYNINDGIMGER